MLWDKGASVNEKFVSKENFWLTPKSGNNKHLKTDAENFIYKKKRIMFCFHFIDWDKMTLGLPNKSQ